MKVLKYEWRDLVALIIVVALFVAILLDKYLIGGEGIFVGIDRLIAQLISGMVGR